MKLLSINSLNKNLLNMDSLNKKLFNKWEFFSTLAIFLFGFSIITRKMLYEKNDFQSTVFFFMLFTSIFLALSCGVFYKQDKNIFKKYCKNKTNIIIGITAAMLYVGGIIVKNKAYQLSPNAAYVDVFNEPIKIMLVYIISVLFLSAKFNPASALGLAIALVGIYIIVKNQ